MRTNKHGRTDYLPKSLARDIRKQCGFGCVVCGSAFYDYEHWNPPFEELNEEPTADGITLACPNHHRAKGGLLSRDEYEKCVANPAALRDGYAGATWSKGFAPDIVLGNVRCKGGTRIVSINGETMIGFDQPEDDGAPPRLTARFFNAESQEVFRIEDNRCIGDPNNWDLTSNRVNTGGWRWEVRHKAGKIDLILEMFPPDEIHIKRMAWRNGLLKIDANDRGIQVSLDDPNGPHSIMLLRGGTVSPLEDAHGFIDISTQIQLDPNTKSGKISYHLHANHIRIESAQKMSFAHNEVL